MKENIEKCENKKQVIFVGEPLIEYMDIKV